jgi:flagellar basal-body rod protein FlgB
MERVDDALMDGTMRLLAKTLGYRSRRHGVIAANLANIDTPGYRPQELVFEQELQRAGAASDVHLKRSHPQHLPGPGAPGPDAVLRPSGEPSAGGTTSLNLDKEMAKMAQNNLLYEAEARLLSKKFEALRMAIDERRR